MVWESFLIIAFFLTSNLSLDGMAFFLLYFYHHPFCPALLSHSAYACTTNIQETREQEKALEKQEKMLEKEIAHRVGMILN